MAARAQLEHMRGNRPALPMSGRGIPGMPGGGTESDGDSPGQYL
jgi:hypothetical protein